MNIPSSPGVKLDEFDPEEPQGVWALREVSRSLMWFASRRDRTLPINAVRAVARYCHPPNWLDWKTVLLQNVRYSKCVNPFGLPFQQVSGIDVEAFADAHFASRETDRMSDSDVVCAKGQL